MVLRVYMWLDDKGKKSKLSAPQYVDYVMTYVQKVSCCEIVKLREREGQRVDLERSLKGHL